MQMQPMPIEERHLKSAQETLNSRGLELTPESESELRGLLKRGVTHKDVTKETDLDGPLHGLVDDISEQAFRLGSSHITQDMISEAALGCKFWPFC